MKMTRHNLNPTTEDGNVANEFHDTSLCICIGSTFTGQYSVYLCK